MRLNLGRDKDLFWKIGKATQEKIGETFLVLLFILFNRIFRSIDVFPTQNLVILQFRKINLSISVK